MKKDNVLVVFFLKLHVTLSYILKVIYYFFVTYDIIIF